MNWSNVRATPPDCDRISFVDQLPEIVWHADERGDVDYVNTRFCDVTGFSPSAALGSGWIAALHPDDVARTQRGWRTAVASGAGREDEIRLRARDGTYRWYTLRTAPYRAADGTLAGWLAACADIQVRRRSEDALALLLEAGTQLLSSLGLDESYETICRVMVPRQASWAMIARVDAGARASVVAIRHRDRAHNAAVQTLLGATFCAADRFGAPIRRGEPELLPALTFDWLATVEPRMRAVFAKFETASTIGIPIRSGHRVEAVLTLGRTADAEPYVSTDVPVYAEVARRFSLATAYAARFDNERRVATTFQRAALPGALPRHPHVSFDAVYEAGKSEALVGGDWYDAFVLGDGRIVVSIGDVSGSGLAAAVAMGLVRQSMRAAARVTGDPLAILDAADRTLRADDSERVVTAFVGIFDPAGGTLVYAGAGHPPPLVRAADGTIEELTASSLPLGLRRAAQTAGAGFARLEPGALVVLHTDGLTEATRDLFEGERRLRAALADPRLLASSEPAHFLRRAVLLEPAHDDVAILTMRLVSGYASEPEPSAGPG